MLLQNIETAESIIRSWLKSLGYYKIEIAENKKKVEDSFIINADGALRNITLEVKIGKSNTKVSSLSTAEIEKLRGYAANDNREPWAAIVKLDSTGQLVDTIKWKNLTTVK